MARPIRPQHTFVLHLWREPGDREGEAGWRGRLRPLNLDPSAAVEQEVRFQGLEKLLEALRPWLAADEAEE